MNRPTRGFLLLTYLLGILAVVYAFAEPWGERAADAVVFVLLGFLAEWLAVRLPGGSYSSVTFAVHLGAMLALGVRVPVVSAIINAFQPADFAARKPVRWILFNAAQTAIANVAVYLAFSALGGVATFASGTLSVRTILAVLASVPAGFLVNAGLVSLSIALEEQTSVVRVWQRGFRWLVPGYFALAALGVLLAASYTAARLAGVLLLIAPLLIARQVFVLYLQRRTAYYQTVHSLVAAIEAKDPYTRGHSERVADYAVRTAEELGFDAEAVEKVRFAALLHDLGKIAVDRRILNKPAKLTDEEYAVVKEHPELGARILGRISFLKDSIPAIRAHHERPDGHGYGRGLGSDEIPRVAKVLAVADGFDAMTSARPYRAALSVEEAVAELLANSGDQFDSHVVRAFANALGLHGAVATEAAGTGAQLRLDEVAT